MRILLALSLLIFLASCKGNVTTSKNTKVNLDSLVQLYPDSVPLLVTYGRQLLDDYQLAEALNYGAKAFRLDSNNIEARFIYASALVNRPQRSQADIDVSQKHLKYIIQKQPGNKEAFLNLATTYTLQGDFQKSFGFINEALKIDKKYRDAYVMKGMNYHALGDMKLAKSSFETAVQQDPKFFIGYLQLGWLYTETEEYKYALEYFKTAVELEPTSTDALYGVAKSQQELGLYPEALASYRQLIQTDTSYHLALFNQGYIKQFYQNELDSAVYFYKSAIEIQPDFVNGWHNLGLTYAMQGRKNMAYKAYKKALEYNPDFELTQKEIMKLK